MSVVPAVTSDSALPIARDDLRTLRVADRRHLDRQRSFNAVQCYDLFGRFCSTHYDRRSPQLGEIKSMEGLIDLEQDVIRRVDDVVDGPLPDALKTLREPRGTRPHLHAPDYGDHVSGCPLGIVESYRDSVDCGG